MPQGVLESCASGPRARHGGLVAARIPLHVCSVVERLRGLTLPSGSRHGGLLPCGGLNYLQVGRTITRNLLHQPGSDMQPVPGSKARRKYVRGGAKPKGHSSIHNPLAYTALKGPRLGKRGKLRAVNAGAWVTGSCIIWMPDRLL